MNFGPYEWEMSIPALGNRKFDCNNLYWTIKPYFMAQICHIFQQNLNLPFSPEYISAVCRAGKQFYLANISTTVFSLINALPLINAPPILWPSHRLLNFTKMTTVSLIMVRFSSQNHRWKAENVSYHTSPLVLAPGAFIRENTVYIL